MGFIFLFIKSPLKIFSFFEITFTTHSIQEVSISFKISTYSSIEFIL